MNYREVVSVLRQQHSVVSRVSSHNPNGLIYENNGALWGRISVYPTRSTKGRIDFSWGTNDWEVARKRRDELFHLLEEGEVAGDDCGEMVGSMTLSSDDFIGDVL